MSENVYKVYAIVQPITKKMYIGCTKKSLSARFDNGNGYKKCRRLWEDIQKYGFDSFEKYVIFHGLSKEQAYEAEDALIAHFQLMDPEKGYNMRRGGLHNTPCEEVGRHISESKMGHEVSEGTREKLRKHFGRPVYQLSKDGKLIKRFRSLTDAASSVGTFKSNIYAVCAGKKKSCKGFLWIYEDDFCEDRVKHTV